MNSHKFAIFILSHGRAGNVKTAKTILQSGYSGDWFILIDDEDAQAAQYRKTYGSDRIVQFSKAEYAGKTDTMDNFKGRNVVVFARNAVHKIASTMGFDYILVLDDDYSSFMLRHEEDCKLKATRVCDLDKICGAFVKFLSNSGAETVAFAQSGDFIGGMDSGNWRKGLLRKAMNSFFIKTSKGFDFVGRINEDVNTYCLRGSIGKLWFTICKISLQQTQTQANAGGLTDAYLDLGTYVKSFYSVMAMPSCVKVKCMGDKHRRLHHSVNWGRCVPKIISEEFRKA